jgi:putative ABC transport system substrate-binding protein
MRRREFITLISSAAAAWPLATQAQQPTIPVIGWLHGANPDAYAPMANAFRKSLNESGYFEIQNVRIDTAGLKVDLSVYRNWRAIWCVVKCP